MKRFILSDLHIGYENSLYPIIDKVITYISQRADPGDKILGLGDWFHMEEEGFDKCIKNEMTQKFRDLALKIPTQLVLGNHDEDLEDYQYGRKSPNPISPIEIINPFWENGFLYCHGHEYDFITKYFKIPAFWDLFVKRKTPGELISEHLTGNFLMAAYRIYSNALLDLPKKAKKDGHECKGIVLGHTHFPLIQQTPELPYLVNSGDMRHSATFVVQDDDGFHLVRWNYDSNQWLVTASLSL